MSENNLEYTLYDQVIKDHTVFSDHLKKSLNLFVATAEYALGGKESLVYFHKTLSKVSEETVPFSLPIILKRNPDLRVLYITKKYTPLEEGSFDEEIIVASPEEAELLLAQSSLEFDLVLIEVKIIRFSLLSKLKKRPETISIRIK